MEDFGSIVAERCPRGGALPKKGRQAALRRILASEGLL